MTNRTHVQRNTAAPYQSKQDYLRSLDYHNRICNIGTGELQPWLTLVMGSGCTSSKSQADALLGMASALEAALADLRYEKRFNGGRTVDGVPLSEVVRHFAEDLIADRLRIGRRESSGVPRTKLPEEDEWVAHVFVAAALLTKLYFEIKALSNDAPRRPDHGDEALLSPDSTSWSTLKEEFIDPCREVLKSLMVQTARIAERLGANAVDEVGGTNGVNETVVALVKRTIELVSPGDEKPLRLSLWDLQSIAEFAWLSLTATTSFKDGESVYPGWGDLLLHLSNYDAVDEGRVGMPMFRTMSAAQEIIRSRYESITSTSWMASPKGLYTAAAKLLVAEQKLRNSLPKASPDQDEWVEPPLPAAFVTSFDLELELALLREERPFSIALPVHVYSPGNVATSWLAIRVPRVAPATGTEQSLKKLIEPEESQVHVLGRTTQVDGPLVVRLAGCPLIKVPKLSNAPKLRGELAEFFAAELAAEAGSIPQSDPRPFERRVKDLTNALFLEPAVVISEHDAILQNLLDLLPTDDSTSEMGADQSWSGEADGQRIPKRLGLYPAVTRGTRRWSRIWMLLGVQIRDSAVRQRIATLVSAALRSDPPMSSGRRGVAVNEHITELEQDLLLWNGLSVVKCDAADFALDLAHYTAHLDSNVPFTSGDCGVKNAFP